MKISKNLRATIRFNDEDFERIASDSLSSRKSIPQLLKDAYFNRMPTRVLLGAEGERQFFAEIKRIGNNINQIARHLNSNEHVGKSEFESINSQLRALFTYVRGMSGNS